MKTITKVSEMSQALGLTHEEIKTLKRHEYRAETTSNVSFEYWEQNGSDETYDKLSDRAIAREEILAEWLKAKGVLNQYVQMGCFRCSEYMEVWAN